MREGDGLRQCSYFVVCITLLNNKNKIKNNRIMTFYNYCSILVLILYKKIISINYHCLNLNLTIKFKFNYIFLLKKINYY